MKVKKTLLLTIMLVEWLTLVTQLELHLQNSVQTTSETLVRYFSFYTILTNILVGVMVTILYFTKSTEDRNSFFHKPGVQTAIAMHITIVGLIYNLLLRGLWTEGGLQSVINDVLHSLLPLLTIIFWWLYTDARRIKYSAIFAWLIYPLLYTLYTFIRGTFAGWYPYPFMNVTEFGYQQVFINCSFVTLAFIFFSLLFVFLGRLKK